MDFNKYAVGIVIKRLRQQKKMSQDLLSGLAGIARSHLSMIENGKKQANFETICRIANALEIPPHVIVKNIEDEIKRNEENNK